MFYSTQILSKKGALGTIWLASHLEKRLKRSQVFEANIPASVDSIINPEAPLALRLSGQLLLGIVRVYWRKLEYLSKDAQSAVDNLNRSSAQGGANVDLEGEGRAAYGAITLDDLGPGGMLTDDAFMFQATASAAFDSRGGFVPNLSGGGGDSLAPVEDVSELWGSRGWGLLEEERFEAAGEEINRRFSIELERLRAEAPALPPAPGDLFFQAPPEDMEDLLAPVPDEHLEVPSDAMLAAAGATPAKTPASAGAPLPGTSDIGITPQSLGLDLLPEVEGPTHSAGTFDTLGGELFELGALEVPEAGEPSPSKQRRQPPPPRRKKKPAQIDVDAEGRPATVLQTAEIRALLLDREPIKMMRGLAHRQRPVVLAPQRFDVAAQSEQARHSLLYRPGTFTALAPALMELYNRAMSFTGAEAPEPQGPAAEEAATPQRSQGAAAAAAEGGPAAAGALEGLPTACFSEGAFDFGGGPSEFTLGEDHELPPPPLEPPVEEEDLIEATPAAAAAAAGTPARIGSLAAFDLGEEGEGEGEGEEGREPDTSGPLPPAASFTARSRHVLAEFRRRFVPAAGSKRKSGGTAVAALSLGEVVEGKGRGEACRWFYEALVLRNNSFVELEQREPYGDILIHASAKMLQPDSPAA